MISEKTKILSAMTMGARHCLIDKRDWRKTLFCIVFILVSYKPQESIFIPEMK